MSQASFDIFFQANASPPEPSELEQDLFAYMTNIYTAIKAVDDSQKAFAARTEVRGLNAVLDWLSEQDVTTSYTFKPPNSKKTIEFTAGQALSVIQTFLGLVQLAWPESSVYEPATITYDVGST